MIGACQESEARTVSLLIKSRKRRRMPVVEHCWLVVGERQGAFWRGRRVQPTTGTLVSVEFDPHWAIDREERRGDVIGFYHTHPSGMPDPSNRDLKTMRSWVDAFGKPLLCYIEASGIVGCFLFDDGDQTGRVLDCARFPRGVVIAYDA